MLDEPTEECGIMGMYSYHDIDTFSLSQFGLFALQHRGQEACGISVLKDGRIHSYKDEGLVLDVFKSIENPETYMGIPLLGIPVIQLPEIKRNITISHSLQRMNMIRLFFLLHTTVTLPMPEY
jgi:glucosamine 6-phosphate synthetase-like amidotransferase/phosphosugar isomerase protein